MTYTREHLKCLCGHKLVRTRSGNMYKFVCFSCSKRTTNWHYKTKYAAIDWYNAFIPGVIVIERERKNGRNLHILEVLPH